MLPSSGRTAEAANQVIFPPTSFTAGGASVRHTATACRQKDGGMSRKWEEKERKREKGNEADGWREVSMRERGRSKRTTNIDVL